MAKKNSIRSKRTSAFVHQHGLCFYCGFAMWNHSPTKFAARHSLTLEQTQQLKCTAEHLCARQDGGGNAKDNIVAACLYCNAARHQIYSGPEPHEYRRIVESRLAAGRWHI